MTRVQISVPALSFFILIIWLKDLTFSLEQGEISGIQSSWINWNQYFDVLINGLVSEGIKEFQNLLNRIVGDQILKAIDHYYHPINRIGELYNGVLKYG
ncbi:MAG: hypothetical protein GKC02_10375 [Methanomassiliicoccales archaeon]|nr:hypothetical protein [Methanomassiliicoccales archaeon]